MSKIAKIAGIVMAVHVVIFLVIVQPGCQTQPTATPMESPELGEREWDDSDFDTDRRQEEQVPRERYAPRRPDREPETRTAEPATGGILDPIPSDPVRRPDFEDEQAGTYTVRSGDSLWAIAQRHNVSMHALMDANGLTEDSVIQPGQDLVIPGGSRPRASSPDRTSSSPAPRPEGTTTYTVERGDSLSVIAQRHGTSVSRLRELNNISGDTIRIGQTLVVPEGGGRSGGGRTAPRETSRSVSDSGERHVVASGETPGGIASQYGVSVDELMHANNISDPRRMRVGQELVIPDAGGEASSPQQEQPSQRERREPEPEPEPEEADPRSIPIEPAQPRATEEEEDEDIPVIPIVPRSN